MGSPARSRSGDTAINSRVLCQLSYGGMNPHKVAALPERFAARVSVQDDGCWIWTGAKASNGYGSIGYESRTHSTHRLAYTLLVGPVPEGLQLDHLCRVKSCCNPAHLEPVTNAENQARRSWPTCKPGGLPAARPRGSTSPTSSRSSSPSLPFLLRGRSRDPRPTSS